MTPKEIKSLVKLMRSQGIVQLKTPEIELVVSSTAPIKRKRITKQDTTPIQSGFKGYTDEELLAWSSRAEDNS